MSLFGMLGDLDDDPIFGHQMRQIRQMNNMMNSLFSDPFGMFGSMESIAGPVPLTGGRNVSLMPFGFPQMPSPMNRLLLNQVEMPQNGMAYSSSSVFSMSSGPDGTPQVYKATSSTKTGPGGVKETRKTVEDSRTGLKKMAIGHHIGERAHIIEREQNLHTGVQEENQDFINLDEEEADNFDREFHNRAARNGISIAAQRPAQLALPSNESNVHPHPYGPGRRNHHRPIKGPSHYH